MRNLGDGPEGLEPNIPESLRLSPDGGHRGPVPHEDESHAFAFHQSGSTKECFPRAREADVAGMQYDELEPVSYLLRDGVIPGWQCLGKRCAIANDHDPPRLDALVQDAPAHVGT